MTVVAGVVVETLPGRAADVARRLALGGPEGAPPVSVAVHGHDGDRKIATVFTADDGAALEAFGQVLLSEDEEIVGLFPTFAGTDAP